MNELKYTKTLLLIFKNYSSINKYNLKLYISVILEVLLTSYIAVMAKVFTHKNSNIQNMDNSKQRVSKYSWINILKTLVAI